MMAPPWLPYVFGALGGLGVICVWYGLKGVRDPGRTPAQRRNNLWLVNAGVVLVAASLALSIWLR